MPGTIGLPLHHALEAADFAARILTNFFANEGMEIVQKKFLLENGN